MIAGSFYTFAFPAYMGSIFFRYRKEIRKDLSVNSEGKAWRRDLAAIRIQSHVRGHNHRKVFKTGHYYSRNARVHNTVMVRKHYGKLYEDFRPGKFWWRLVLMSRKALLAFTIFVPASAPVFQASMVLMILFVSFVLQVKYRPYASRPSMPGDTDTPGYNARYSPRQSSGQLVGLGFAAAGNRGQDGKGGDLAKLRWRRAIMTARAQVRWRTQTEIMREMRSPDSLITTLWRC